MIKKILILVSIYLFIGGFQDLKAQTSCIGGGSITVELICIEMLAGGEIGNEEPTVLTTVVDNTGATLINADCGQTDSDIGGGGSTGAIGPGFSTMTIPYPYTTGNFGDDNTFPNTIDITFDVWEDDGGNRCDFDTGGGAFTDDDDNFCASGTTTVDVATLWGTGGACPVSLLSDGSVNACTVTAPNVFRVNCGGEWVITYQVYVDFSIPLDVDAPLSVALGGTAPVYGYEIGTTNLISGGTWTASPGAITDNGDGSAVLDATGLNDGDLITLCYSGDNCCQTTTECTTVKVVEFIDANPDFTSAIACPASGEEGFCGGETMSLEGYIQGVAGTPKTESVGNANGDYIAQWEVSVDGGAFNILNVGGTDITSAGPDGINFNADDTSIEDYSYALPTPPNCGKETYDYRLVVFPLAEAIDQIGADCPSAIRTYDFGSGPNGAATSVIEVDLSAGAPAGATVKGIEYNIIGTTQNSACGGSYGNSWVSELRVEVVGTSSGGGYTSGVINPNGPGAPGPFDPGLYADFNNTVIVNPPLPADGVWTIHAWDTFNDNGGAEGEFSTGSYIRVIYCLPPTPIGAPGENITQEYYPIACQAVVCKPPVINTDFSEPAPGCNPAVTINCTAYPGDPINDSGADLPEGAAVLYSTDGGTTYTSIDPYDAVSITATDISDQSDLTVEYQIVQPGCPDCANVTGSFTLSLPADPSITDDVICSGETAALMATCGAGEITNWYSDMAGTTQVGTGSSFTPADTAPGVYTYYAQCVDGNGCLSNLVPVMLTISENPDPALTCPPAEIGQCGGEFNCMFNDANPNTQANGTEAAPIISGSAASFVTDPVQGIIDPVSAPVNVPLTLILTYTDPVSGCTASESCTFTVVSSGQSAAGGF